MYLLKKEITHLRSAIDTLKNTPLWAIIRPVYRASMFLVNTPRMKWLVKKARSNERLQRLKRLHEGETFFVLGAGPSLNRENLSVLAGQNVVSTHFSYLSVEGIPVGSHYWVVAAESRMGNLACVDREKFTASIWAPGSVKRWRYPFSSFSSKDIVIPNVIRRRGLSLREFRGFLDPSVGENIINEDLAIRSPVGNSVIFTGIEVASFLGAGTIVLLGADFDASGVGSDGAYFSSAVPVVDEMMSNGADPYLKRYEENIAPALAWYRGLLEKRGVELYNASANTRDDVLDKVNLNELSFRQK